MGGEPEADDDADEVVVELVEDGPLPDEGPNSATSDRETIRGGDGAGSVVGSRLRRLPRAVRVAGVLTVALIFAVAVWPAAGRREAAPRPVPTPSQINVDLFKVRLGQTTLDAGDGADHAVLDLELTNSATTRLEVVSAELWDAVGTRLGSASVWPAKGLGAGTTVSVPVTLPYACDVYGFLPVLPITVRYSISTPQNPDAGHDYAYPLTDAIWDTYMRQRAAQCARPGDELSAAAIDTTQPIGEPSDPQGFDLTFTIESSGQQAWSLDKVTGFSTGVSITGNGLPVAVSPGQTARVSTHWHVDDCDRPPKWSTQMGVEFTARPTGATGAASTAGATGTTTGGTAGPTTGGTSPTGAEQVFVAQLRPGLVTEMLYEACGI